MLSVILLASSVVDVSAQKTRTITDTYIADAFWLVENSDGGITEYSLSAIEATKGDLTAVAVTADIYSANGSHITHRTGSVETENSVFTIDKDLESASLSEVTVGLLECSSRGICSIVDHVTVSADWTGIGDINESRSKSVFSDGSITVRSKGIVTERSALATVIYEGEESETDLARLSKWKAATVERTT